MSRRPLLAALLLVILGVAALALYRYSGAPEDGGAPKSERASNQALIGGPFTLVNQQGETVTDKTYAGKYMLVFFGYTYCPDVCPVELQTMTQALDMMTAAGRSIDKIQPIFITVDPERDTAQVMADYVASFHPKLVGLTGAPEQIAQVKRAYRVYSAKAPDESGGPDAYLMDHTALVYVMGPDGKYVSHFPAGVSAEDMAAKLTELTQ